MERIAAWALAHTLFWAGHIISYLMRVDCLWWLYRPYNWLMCKASDIQDEYGLSGPWYVLDGDDE